jgi:hypothetical protein
MTINDLTLSQFAKFREVEKSKLSDTDKALKLASIITDKSLNDIEDLPGYKLETLLTKVAFVRQSKLSDRIKKVIWIKGKRYKLVKSAKHLSTNQYTAFKTYQQNNLANYHNLASIIYMRCPLFMKPYFDYENRAELAENFKSIKVGKVFGSLFFYSKTFRKLRDDSLLSLSQSKAKISLREMEIQMELEDLGLSMDGTGLLSV